VRRNQACSYHAALGGTSPGCRPRASEPPALSVPCGFSAEGLPIGLEIVGRAFDEATVLRIGAAYERAMPWRARRPSL
jgi:Asp-tRNA(Asn)/Glu-tRNA(Gln) amidotransferase A subunit family amidase